MNVLTVVLWEWQKLAYRIEKWYKARLSELMIGDKYLLTIADRDILEGATSLQRSFGGKVDRVPYPLYRILLSNNRNENFETAYLTGTARDRERRLPKPDMEVVVTSRGKEVPKRLDFLDGGRDYSILKKALTRDSNSGTTPRRSSVSDDREIAENVESRRDSAKIQPSNVFTRRETRSQKALLKNVPYVHLETDPELRYLEYPLDAVRNKITIYQDDLERLKDDEFLNDTIIDFYLMYIYDHLPDTVKAEAHFFNTFFWTSLTRKKTPG